MGNDFPELAVRNIDKALLNNAYSVVRYDNTAVTLKSIENVQVHSSYAISVLNKKGDEWLVFSEMYKEGSSKIKDIVIEILDANGRLIKKVKKNEIEDYASNGDYSMISDNRVKLYQYHPTSYPLTFKVAFLYESKNTMILPSFIPIPGFNVSVEKSNYSIDNQTEIELKCKEINLNKYGAKNNGNHNYSIERIPAFEKEKFMPEAYSFLPVVYFSPERFVFEGETGSYSNWNEYGQWVYSSFLEKRNNLKNQTIKEELAKHLTDPDNKISIIKDLYKYVQQNMRYISIALDEGGFQPMLSGDVHKLKYGDCKALSFYMMTLLQAYNIDSKYVEVYASSTRKIDLFTDFASVAQGNHIILNIPLEKDTIWLDCTSHYSPFNYLGRYSDDRQVLEISASGGNLIHTPGFSALENMNTDSVVVNLESDNRISGTVKINRKGLAIENTLGLLDAAEKKKTDFARKNIFSNKNQVQVLQAKMILDDEKIQMNERYSFEKKGFAEQLGEFTLIPTNLTDIDIPFLPKMKERNFDIHFKRPYMNKSELSLTLHSDYALLEKYEDVIIENEYVKYERSVKLEDRILTISRAFQLNKGKYPKEKYQEIKSIIDKIRKYENQKIALQNP
ncbi:MAG: DUF3857 domain-containing protein [Bacteroidetes bacterium]|nr:DUF3857 domain-containing protein [Bacteroidota bacterium]